MPTFGAKTKRRSSLNVCKSGLPKSLKRSSSIPSIAERKYSSHTDDDESSDKDCEESGSSSMRRKDKSSSSLELPPPCTCPYFGDRPSILMKPIEVKIIKTTNNNFLAPENKCQQFHHHHHHMQHHKHPLQPPALPLVHQLHQSHDSNSHLSSNNSIPNNVSTNSLAITQTASPVRKLSYSKCNSVVTWDPKRYHRRGSSFKGGNGNATKTSLLQTPAKSSLSPLRRSVTLKYNNNIVSTDLKSPQKAPSSPCILQRTTTVRSHHSRNSSVISRNSSRHGRIIRLGKSTYSSIDFFNEILHSPAKKENMEKLIIVCKFSFYFYINRTESNQSVRSGILHIRSAVVTLFRAQPLFKLRGKPMGFWLRHLAGLCQFYGQPHLLYNIQQSVPAGIQKRFAMQIQ